MTMDIIYGTGFEVTDVKEEVLICFLKNHQESISKNGLQVWNENEINEEAHCTISDNEGRNAVVQNVMHAETGICFEFRIDEEAQREYILLPELPPWLYNEKEKALTHRDLCEILNRYITELGLETYSDDIRIEYFS